MTRPDIPVADRVRGHWADRYIPMAARPYARMARLERPIGWWLLLWPCWWSSVLATNAAGAWPNLWHLVLFLVGAVAMRGAGCTYNDIVDRDLDAQVVRTRSRPIPSGAVTVRQAQVFLAALALLGLVVLLQFNWFTVGLGVLSLATVAIYPFLKRVTDWPQLGLGLAFSWGALLGWSAVFGRLDPAAFVLYAAAIAWTVFYDTIYAHQDTRDDAVIGVRSTARLFGAWTKPVLIGFAALTAVLLAAALALAGAGPLAYAGLVLFAGHLGWQVRTLDASRPAVCLMLFKSNRDAGWLLFAGLLADGVVRNGLA